MERSEIIQGLGNFRKGLFQIAAVLLGTTALILPFSKPLLRHFYEMNLKTDLVAFTIPEALFSLIKVSFYAGLFVSAPVILYQVWKSFSHLFRQRGMKASFPVLLASILLFYLGASFCYFVTLPFGIQFLLGYQSTHIKPMISVTKYVSFCFVFILGFGLTFELPLVLALLSYIRVVNGAFLVRNRRYAILLIAITAAVVTPTPDIFNMALMGGPLYLLFEIGVILVRIIERKRARQETLPS
jgi:sec-independent protein translocase protein TatC